MKKLQKDADVVEQVRAIVQVEEGVMAQETQIVQDYAQVCHVLLKPHSCCKYCYFILGAAMLICMWLRWPSVLYFIL